MKQTLLVVVAMLFAANAAVAQRSASLRLGVSGGSTRALHDVSGQNTDGFNLGIHAILPTRFAALALKVEAQHNELRKKEFSPFAKTLVTSVGPSLQVTPGIIPLSIRPFPDGAIAPYFSAGGGGYRIQTSSSSGVYYPPCPACAYAGNVAPSPYPNRSVTKLGWNASGGVRVPFRGVDAFVEAQYHHIRMGGGSDISKSISFAPLSVGVSF